MTILDNFKRFMIASPPWVIFMLSLGAMALGILFLGYRLKIDPDFGKGSMDSVHMCYQNDKSSEKREGKSILQAYPFNVSVPVSIHWDTELGSYLPNKSSIHLSGQLHSGQMGLKGARGSGHNWTFIIGVGKNGAECTDHPCSENLLHTCLLLLSDQPKSLPSFLLEEECGGNTSVPLNLNAVAASSVYSVSNWRDESSSTPSSKFCSNAFKFRLNIDERAHFVLIPIVHDSVAARLHLLYTSYFLFAMLIVMVGYAVCKGRTYKHHISSEHILDEKNGNIGT